MWTELGEKAAQYTADLDLDEVLAAFEVKEKAKDAGKKEKEKPKVVSTAVGGNRQQNIGIVLNFMKLPLNELRDALIKMDEDVIPAGQLDSIVKILPQPDELKGIQREKQDPEMVKVWGPVERYVDVVGGDIPDLSKRLTLWIFMNEFDSYAEEICRDMEKLNAAIDALLDPKARIKEVFSVILSLGNLLNRGTRHGNCPGFTVANLDNLSGCKTADGKSNLLVFIVKFVMDKKPELKDWPEDIQALAGLQVASAAIGNSVSQLGQGMRTLKRTMEDKVKVAAAREEAAKKKGETIDPDDCVANEARLMAARLESFCKAKEKSAAQFEQRQAELAEKVAKLATSYAEDPASFDEIGFCSCLYNFGKSWDAAAKDIIRAREREEKARKKKEEKEGPQKPKEPTVKKPMPKPSGASSPSPSSPAAGGSEKPAKVPTKVPTKVASNAPAAAPAAAPPPAPAAPAAAPTKVPTKVPTKQPVAKGPLPPPPAPS